MHKKVLTSVILGSSFLATACLESTDVLDRRSEAAYAGSKDANSDIPPREQVDPIAKPSGPVELFPSLSYVIDAKGSQNDPDCFTMSTITREDNRFSFEFFSLGEAGEPGTSLELKKICQVKGSVIVPAGYLVDVDVEERIQRVVTSLSENSTASLQIAIDTNQGGESFSKAYASSKTGPLFFVEDDLVMVPNERNAQQQEKYKDCSRVKNESSTLEFSIAYENALSIADNASGPEGMFLVKSPAFAFKFIKCENKAPERAAAAAGEFFFTLNDEANKIGCPSLNLVNKKEKDARFGISPISLDVDPSRNSTILDQSCLIKGQVLVPANHIVKIRSPDRFIAGSLVRDQQATLSVNYAAVLCGPEFIGCGARANFKLSGQIALSSQDLSEVDLTVAEDTNLDCTQAKDKNEVLEFELRYGFEKRHNANLNKTNLGRIDTMPGVEFELLKCN